MASKKRIKYKELSIGDKIKLIQENERQPTSQRKLATKFEISKSQVQRIIANKENILKRKDDRISLKRQRLLPALKYDDVDQGTFTWFCNARSYNIPVSGPLIQAKALEIARAVNPETTFNASNGWLKKFLRRHEIVFRAISGEGADTDSTIVEEWLTQLPEIHASFKPEDIFNIDETGLFYRQIPRKSYVEMKDSCIGGKQSKLRLTVCLFTNMVGQKEPPIIIGNAKRPRCFGRIDVNRAFNIDWQSNKSSWMTAEIFENILRNFNRKMKLQSRKVILFLDNARVHPNIELSNVKLQFFTANTTSHCQPLDQGIIAVFKSYYRKLLLSHIISKLDENMTGDILNANEDVLPKILVIDALGWIEEAWKLVQPDTIKKCFAKAGFVIDVPNYESEEPLGMDSILASNDLQNFVNFDNEIETSEDRLNFEEWETDYIEYLSEGGNIFEFQAGDYEDAQANETDLNNQNETLSREQLIKQVQDLNALISHSSNSGNNNLFINVKKTIREIEWMVSSGSNTKQAPITNFFRPTTQD